MQIGAELDFEGDRQDAAADGIADRTSAAAFVQNIFDREMGVTLSNAKAGSKRDEAMRELTREAANLYAKRVLRELIQNAYDGARTSSAPRILLRLDLTEGTHGTIYVANNGQGFTCDNVDAISNPAMSNKTPGNFIGHKGLGFRSVELLSDSVEIFSKIDPTSTTFDGFCFRFATPDDERGWLDSVGEAALTDIVVGKVHRLQLPVPIDVTDDLAEAVAGAGFSTLVRLPLRDAVAAARAGEEMRLLLDEKAPITLFLDRLQSLLLETVDADGKSEPKELRRSGKGAEKSSFGRNLTLEEVTVDRYRYLVGRMEVDDAAFRASVDRAVAENHPVERWKEWKGAPSVSVALPLSQDAKAGNFFAFLPMDTPAPFNGCLDAPFYPDANRRDLDLDNPLNGFLLDSVADLCLAVARTVADSDTISLKTSAAAVDALAWHADPQRLSDACERADFDVGDIMLPAVRRGDGEKRWAPLSEIYDWNDDKFGIVTGQWLVRACGVPMVRRALGTKRLEALRTFIDESDYGLEPSGTTIADWAPILAKDLNGRRRKATKQDWESFYADLAKLRPALPHMRGKAIFRLEDGTLGAANSPETLGERELFISSDPENATRRRKRLAGTTLFPPKSVAQRMQFADPLLSWPQPVTAEFVNAGLATEYSLPRVIAGMGRLLGKRPKRQTALAAINWAFDAWKSHKSPEVEKALLAAQLPVLVADGKFKTAPNTRFSSGWRDTTGDIMQELCDEIGSATRPTKNMVDSLVVPWDQWPSRDRGTASDWVHFLRLLGVKDGLRPVFYPSVSEHVNTWIGVRRGYGAALSIESRLGVTWRAALSKIQRSFSYQSGNYATNDTLFALPLQGEHAGMSDRAKQAYARLVAKAVPDIDPKYFTTVLNRTAGMGDTVNWPSPLLAFLQEAEWLPVSFDDELSWKRPGDCWFSPRTEALPYFLPRIERPIREALDGNAKARDVFSTRLGLRMWNAKESAPARIEELGKTLERGIAEHEHGSFRSEYRQAWSDWNSLTPVPALPRGILLAVQASGRLMCHLPDPENPRTVFVSGGTDPTLDNLLMALGHRLLVVPADAAANAADALKAAGYADVRLVDEVRPRIIVDDADLDLAAERARLVDDGRDWLAEIAVLALEFHNSSLNRSTPRSRQALFDDFRRLRIIHARDIRVEIDGRTGPLPETLAGVLPVPHDERPTIIIQSAGSSLDWDALARLSRGIALALGRAWLLTDFRMVFLAIATDQPKVSGQLTRPDDEAIASAFGQPVSRIREIQRSLRAGSRRIMDWLLPFICARFGLDAANALLDRETTLIEDDDLVTAIVGAGGGVEEARILVTLCREAEGLDELRRTIGLPLAEFNAAAAALGPRFPPLRFEASLRRAFEERLDELRPALSEQVRNAFTAPVLADIDLAAYREARDLKWISFEESWTETHDDLDDATIDARIAKLADEALPKPIGAPDGALNDLRQRNRTALSAELDTLRRLASAWASKSTGRTLPALHSAKSEVALRELMVSGVFDFFVVEATGMPAALAQVGAWPAAMPQSTDLHELGLEAADLDFQRKEEERRREDDARKSRSMRFGNIEIEGGTPASLQAVADALKAGLLSKAFQARSGPAVLRPFPEGDERPPRKRGPSTSTAEPSFLTDQQRDLIGFAGEYAAYVHLKRTVRTFSDEHWVSSLGRRFLCLGIVQDRGYDFHVPRSRGGLYFEVKAHIGDPGHIDLERSQVEAAVQFADEKSGIWKILYISNVLDHRLITVHELANPFSEGNMRLFRPSNRQGVRLLVDRE
ncbi:ATP-binding protein [Sphingomonas sp. OTU376]|uniref:ATP-binding protein n=1 Tax=Sphingomonas sp. OTU376 TaxID=3043863 RepID=UPI00313D50AB